MFSPFFLMLNDIRNKSVDIEREIFKAEGVTEDELLAVAKAQEAMAQLHDIVSANSAVQKIAEMEMMPPDEEIPF
jgi:Mg2+ and Co2+ transporter CorA